MSSFPVTLWQGYNYATPSVNLNYGNYPTVATIGIGNDTLSSLSVKAFTQLIIYAATNYGGTFVTINGPIAIPNLGIYGNFNDKMSSIKIIRMEPTPTVKMACCDGSGAQSTCGEYAAGSVTCPAVISQFCTAANMNDPRCQSWCRANTALCDTRVIEFCRLNPLSPFCTCINSPANVKGIINPACIDKKCLVSGYTTTNMKQTACPSIVNCAVSTALTNSGVIMANTIPVQQNCGNTTVVQTPAPAPAPVVKTPVTAPISKPVVISGVPLSTGTISNTSTTPIATAPVATAPVTSSYAMLFFFFFIVLIAIAAAFAVKHAQVAPVARGV